MNPSNHQLIHGYFAARRATLANVHQPQSADQPNLQQLQVPNQPRHSIYILGQLLASLI